MNKLILTGISLLAVSTASVASTYDGNHPTFSSAMAKADVADVETGNGPKGSLSHGEAIDMFTIRTATARGHTKLNWLDSWHTFSFDQYYDPEHMNFGPLQVINEDTVAPGVGFGMHPHHDMEIITYVIEGQLRHEDNLGTGSVISPGEIQKMSAGSGVWHSEYNASQRQPVHFLQIWIVPDKRHMKPAYEQKQFKLAPGVWQLLGSPNGDGLISIQQKARMYALSANKDSLTAFVPKSGAKLWIQVVKGACAVADKQLKAGDGLAISADAQINILAKEQTELLLFELLGN